MGRFLMDRYIDEYSPEIHAQMAKSREELKEYWQRRANESKEVQRRLEEHRQRYRCHVSSCQNTSIGPNSFWGIDYVTKEGDDVPDTIGMKQCDKCNKWTCAEHLLHFKTPYVKSWHEYLHRYLSKEGYLRVCVNCLPFNASKMKWPEHPGDVLDKS